MGARSSRRDELERGWGRWDSNPLRRGHRIYSLARLSAPALPRRVGDLEPPDIVAVDESMRSVRVSPISILRVLRTAQPRSPRSPRPPRRDQPAPAVPDEDERAQSTFGWIEHFVPAGPALVAAAWSDDSTCPTLAAHWACARTARGRLHLDTDQAAAPGLRDQVVVWAVPERDRDRSRLAASATRSLMPRRGRPAVAG